MLLYNAHFKEWGVDPRMFKKLVSAEGCHFESLKQGTETLSSLYHNHPLITL